MSKHKLVLIEWLDSHRSDGWHGGEPDTRPLRCRSVGWLIHDGEHAKTIAPHVTDEESPQRCGEMTIPACSVLKMRTLR